MDFVKLRERLRGLAYDKSCRSSGSGDVRVLVWDWPGGRKVPESSFLERKTNFVKQLRAEDRAAECRQPLCFELGNLPFRLIYFERGDLEGTVVRKRDLNGFVKR